MNLKPFSVTRAKRLPYFLLTTVTLILTSLNVHSDEELAIEEMLSGNDAYDKAIKDWFGDTTEKIIGGEEAAEAQFAWQVSIGVSYIADPFRAQYCSGTIIKPDWIVTAAHCVVGLRPHRIKVTAGSNDLSATPVRLNVKRIFVYPGFVHPEQGKDIALLQLRKNLRFNKHVKPISLVDNDSGFNEDTIFTVTGWGQTTSAQDSKSATLRFIEDIPFVDNEICNLPLSYDGRVLDDMICAGFSAAEHGRDSCKGDSGGPLIIFSSRQPRQAGIVSWGDGCAVPLKYGVHTRISTYARWVEKCVTNPLSCAD